MALFVDGPACTIDDLTDQDSGLLDVALDNGINVTTKLRLAQEELKTDLELWLLKPRPALPSPLNYGHLRRMPNAQFAQVALLRLLRRDARREGIGHRSRSCHSHRAHACFYRATRARGDRGGG